MYQQIVIPQELDIRQVTSEFLDYVFKKTRKKRCARDNIPSHFITQLVKFFPYIMSQFPCNGRTPYDYGIFLIGEALDSLKNKTPLKVFQFYYLTRQAQIDVAEDMCYCTKTISRTVSNLPDSVVNALTRLNIKVSGVMGKTWQESTTTCPPSISSKMTKDHYLNAIILQFSISKKDAEIAWMLIEHEDVLLGQNSIEKAMGITRNTYKYHMKKIIKGVRENSSFLPGPVVVKDRKSAIDVIKKFLGLDNTTSDSVE